MSYDLLPLGEAELSTEQASRSWRGSIDLVRSWMEAVMQVGNLCWTRWNFILLLILWVRNQDSGGLLPKVALLVAVAEALGGGVHPCKSIRKDGLRASTMMSCIGPGSSWVA